MAQETQTVALYHLEGWDEEGDGRVVQKVGGGIFVYLPLRFDRKLQNSVKQLSFNKTN